MLSFEVLPFDALTNRQLHDLLRLRCDVFVVEQECAYPELDGRDMESWHLLGWDGGELVAYARWYWDPERDPREPEGRVPTPGAMVLGRIATALAVRRKGYGRRTVEASLEAIADAHPSVPIRIHAQERLERFYQDFGFSTLGEAFDEDGIQHLLMVRNA